MTSSRPLVFISRSLPPAGMRLLEAECDVRVWPEDSNITREGMLQGVVGVDAIICHPPDKVDTEVLNAAGLYIIQVNVSTGRQLCLLSL